MIVLKNLTGCKQKYVEGKDVYVPCERKVTIASTHILFREPRLDDPREPFVRIFWGGGMQSCVVAEPYEHIVKLIEEQTK